MSQPPQPNAKELDFDAVKKWVSTHDWAYWVIALLGVIGIIIVAYYLLKRSSKEKKNELP
jgi:flagellar biogenesis protein FliO